MDFTLADADREFVARLDAWLDANLDPDWANRIRSEEDWVAAQRDWEQKLSRDGWSGIWWPKEHGGRDVTPTQRSLYAELTARRGTPDGLGRTGRRLVGPAVIRYGTPVQQREILPAILRAETIWCQGYSEPNAGSDLASVQTRAVRKGDRYVINGTKLWTGRAHLADRMFMLARTDGDAEKHAGLSILLVDLRQPGVTIRPIEQLTGRRHFCQVFFDDVETSVENIVGREGQGWEVALYILEYERGATYVFDSLVSIEKHLDRYVDLARTRATPGGWADVAKSAAEVAASRLLTLKILSNQINGGDPGMETSIVHLFWTQAWVRLSEQALMLGGEEILAEPPHAYGVDSHADLFLDSRASTIASGTAEIQRTIVARKILGLPK